MATSFACQQQSDGTTKFLINVGVGDPINWSVSIYSNVDYGRGNTGSHNSSYPYFVENFSGSNTQTLYKTYNLQGGYIGTLAPATTSGGYAYCYFTVGGGGGGGGGGSSCANCDLSMNYCISGSCVPKSYLLIGTAGFFMLMMMRK